MTRYVENGQSLSEIDPDYSSEDKYGTRLDKPYGLRLHVHNWYKSPLPNLAPQILSRIPFELETCVICTVNKPNILYANCGHMCICCSRDWVDHVNACPLCRAECANEFYLRHY